MRAIVVERFGTAPTVRQVPEPICPPHGAVVSVEATGLCRSDWHALVGHDPDVTLPHVPGHEFAGRVAAVGEQVTGWPIGTRVTAPFVNACGDCPQCRAGDHQVCSRQTQPGFTRWGSFAERVVVDHAAVNLVALPDEVDVVSAAALGCRFATAFRAVVQVGRVRLGEWVAVHGSGGVGLSAVMVAKASGARVIAVDVRPEALALARRVGADRVVRTTSTDDPLDVAARVREAVMATGGTGDGADLSLDALGSEPTCAASIGCLRPRGRHVQIGLLGLAEGLLTSVGTGQGSDWPRVPMQLVIAKELEVLGSHGMSSRSYPGMLALVSAGLLRPGELVTRVIGLGEAGTALLALGDPASDRAGLTIARP